MVWPGGVKAGGDPCVMWHGGGGVKAGGDPVDVARGGSRQEVTLCGVAPGGGGQGRR